jgi:hypothetical protein
VAIFSCSDLGSDRQDVTNRPTLRPIDAVREIIVGVLSERQQTSQTDGDGKLPRGSRLKNKTGVNITDMDIAKEIEANSQARKRRTPTKQRKPTARRTKRQKRDVIGLNTDREKENETDTDEEASVRQQLDFAIDETAAITKGN